MIPTGPLTDEQMAARGSKRAEQESYLRVLGLAPEAVGTMVVEGIKAGKLYIITDRTMAEQLAARAKALFTALPPETERDRRISQHTASQIRKATRAGGSLAH